MALPGITRFENRVALVTGASSGIGAVICDTLVRHGLIVVGAARTMDPINEAAKRLADEGVKGMLVAYKCDIGKDDEIEQMFDWIEANLGGVDVCVNNAGFAASETLLESDAARIRDMLNVNVIGLIMCTKLTVKSLQKRGLDDGHIIQINSVLGHEMRRAVRLKCYAASKWMVTGLTHGFRKELQHIGSKIRVSAISPGVVKTHFHYGLLGQQKADEFYNNLGALQPQDVANAILHALSQPAHVQVHDIILEGVGGGGSSSTSIDGRKQ